VGSEIEALLPKVELLKHIIITSSSNKDTWIEVDILFDDERLSTIAIDFSSAAFYSIYIF